MAVAVNDLIELFVRDNEVRIDTQGQRTLDADASFTLASRLLDAAACVDEECPLVPFHDQIVVRIIEDLNRTSGGGVHIPDTVQEAALRGVVLAVGPQLKDSKLFIEPPEVGDIISFSRHAGTVTKVGDKSYLTMKAIYALTKIVRDGNTL